jgi:hypothetical protein
MVVVLVVVIVLFVAATLDLMVNGGRDAAVQRAIAEHRATLQHIGKAVAGPPIVSAEPPAVPVPAADPARRRRLQVLATGLALTMVGVGVARLHETGAANPQTAAATTSPPKAAAPTTTAAPPKAPHSSAAPAALTPTSSDGHDVAFASRSPGPILVVAHGRCWVSARDATGTTTFEGTLVTGNQQQITGAWPLRLRLGSPTDVTVYLGHSPALVPARPGRPLNVVFNPT